jgi:glycine betaine/proline transport system substrate-binding protein
LWEPNLTHGSGIRGEIRSLLFREKGETMLKKMALSSLVLGGALVIGANSFGQSAASSAYCASGKTVKFAGITWESGQFTTELVRYILEKGYDCKTEVIPGSTAVTETAMLAGEVNVWAEQWVGYSTIFKKGLEEKKVKLVGDILDGGTLEGWFVPTYMVKGDAKRGIKASTPDLKSVADLEKYKGLFKDDENPAMGRLYNCPVGWSCEKDNGQKLIAYGLDKSFVNFKPGNGAGLDAAIAGAYEKGQPILFYYWAPTGFLGKYDFTRLEEPKYNEACWKTIKDLTNTKPCGSMAPSVDLKFGVTTDIADSDAIIAVMSKVKYSLASFNKVIAEISDTKKAPAEVALNFLKKKPTIWTKWVPASVVSKIKASLK